MKGEKGKTRPAPPLTTVLRELAEKLAADDWTRCATSDGWSFYYIIGMKAHLDAEAGGSDHMSLSIPRGAPASAYGEYLVHREVAARKPSDYYTRHAVSRLAGYLQAASASRMKFEAPSASDPVDGVETVAIRFRETGRPTIVTARRGANIPATGRVWAHAATGTIIKTELSLSDMSTDGRFIVEFAKDERSGLRLPAKMTERHTSPSEEIRATAQYSNVRRFNVSTDETLRKPPG